MDTFFVVKSVNFRMKVKMSNSNTRDGIMSMIIEGAYQVDHKVIPISIHNTIKHNTEHRALSKLNRSALNQIARDTQIEKHCKYIRATKQAIVRRTVRRVILLYDVISRNPTANFTRRLCASVLSFAYVMLRGI